MASHRLEELAFPRLSDEDIRNIAKVAHLKKFKDGQTLIDVGDREFKFFLVKSGEIEILDLSDGPPKRVAVHTEGHFTGDVSHLTGKASIIRAVCRGGCEAYEICDQELRRILQDNPHLSDVILQAFMARRQLLETSPDFIGLRVIGSRYSPDTFRIRDFLARNHSPFKYFDLEDEGAVSELLKRFNIGPEDTPVVACGEGFILHNPSNRQLAEDLGIRRAPEKKVYDLMIIGAGPSGLAAAVYGASEGLSTLVVDREAPGGQAGSSMRIENYLGFPLGITGADLISRAVLQADKFGANISTPTPAVALVGDGAYTMVKLDGEEVTARALVIATGADYRRLKAEGRERFEGAGVYYAATPIEAQLCGNAQVLVVGGGNSAGQAAVFLAGQARLVYVVIRGDDLYKNMSSYLARRIEHTENIKLLKCTEVTRMIGDDHLRQVEVRNNVTGETQTLDAAGVFTFIGAVPRTKWLEGIVDTDAAGFVKTGPSVASKFAPNLKRPPMMLETSRPGIFAAGDVRLGSTKRVASAVGEGAMAIQLVHEYLASL